MIQRGIERREIFQDEKDREGFIERLAEGLEKTGHKCYGWVLMPNHFHLVIRTSVAPVSDLMRKILTGYALYFNKKNKRSGYLYQGRYKSILCQEESYLLELIRYVHLNPLRAGIVSDMASLRKYRWSGHGAIMGETKAPWQETEEILGLFGKKKAAAIKRYEEFIVDGQDMGRRDDLMGGGLIRSIGGWKEVERFKTDKEVWQSDERILGDGEFVSQTLAGAEEQMERRQKLKQEGWDIERVAQKVCGIMGVEIEDIRSKSKRSTKAQAKSLVAYFANKELGISGVELSKYFDITRSSISSSIQRGKKIAQENGYRII